MSNETKIMTSVSTMISFIKSQVKNSLVEANNKKLVDLNHRELERVTNIIEASIETAYTRGASEVINTINKLD